MGYKHLNESPKMVYRIDAIRNSVNDAVEEMQEALEYGYRDTLDYERRLYSLLQQYAEEGGDLSAYAFLNAYEIPFKVRQSNPYSSGSAYVLDWFDSTVSPVKNKAKKDGQETGEGFQQGVIEAVYKSKTPLADAIRDVMGNTKKTLTEQITDTLETATKKAKEAFDSAIVATWGADPAFTNGVSVTLPTPAVAEGKTTPSSSGAQSKSSSGISATWGSVVDSTTEQIINLVLDGKVIASTVNKINNLKDKMKS